MKPFKVLIIDDDPSTCSLIQTILEMEDYQTASINQIEAGIIPLLDKEQPHILILDFHLRDQETLNYIETIRQHPDWQNLAILTISAIDRAEESLKAGANDFLLKPFDFQDIITAVNQMTTI